MFRKIKTGLVYRFLARIDQPIILYEPKTNVLICIMFHFRTKKIGYRMFIASSGNEENNYNIDLL